MSTTKIIRGYMRQSTAEILDKNPYGPVSPLWEDDISGNAIPATIYIGPGKLWTEEEVKKLVRDLREYLTETDFWQEDYDELLEGHGLAL